jgi:hypothetical protein
MSVGFSVLNGSRQWFFTSQFLRGVKTAVQALKDFRTIRVTNKLIQARRKALTF